MNDHARTVYAVCEALAPAAVVLTSAMLPGSDGGDAITRNELITAVLSSIVTGASYARALRLVAARHPDEVPGGPAAPDSHKSRDAPAPGS